LADDWPLLVTRRRRLHNAAHHVDRGYQKDIPTTDPNRQEAAIRFAHRKPSIHGAHVAEIAGSGRLSRPRCALATFPNVLGPPSFGFFVRGEDCGRVSSGSNPKIQNGLRAQPALCLTVSFSVRRTPKNAAQQVKQF
jgi:hypothetical protein